MVGGQALDLRAAEPGAAPLDEAGLREMHARKTGALLRASALAGAVMAGATGDVLDAVGDYGTHIGLAFQIVDDILDVEGASAVLGKTAGKGRRCRQADLSRALRPGRIAPPRPDVARAGAAARLQAAGLGGQLPAIARVGRRAQELKKGSRLDTLLVERGTGRHRASGRGR